MMELSGDYLFDAPQQKVWEALLDPNVLGAVVPGGQGFEQVGENQYTGTLQVKVGPVQGTFQGQITLSDIKAPDSYHIEVDGKGAPGFVKATGVLRLEARANQTYLAYESEAQIGGRIASVGQRLLDSAARSITRQSLDALNEYLKAQVVQSPPATAAAPSEAQEAALSAAPLSPPAVSSAYKPPSQMALALNIARDVFNDLVPVKYQPWLIGGVIIVILLIIWIIASR